VRIRQIKEIEKPGLGAMIREARTAMADAPDPHKKSLEEICTEVGLSKTYWYDIEREQVRGALSIKNLRKIELALGIDFGIDFDVQKKTH
jgi:transcriptional regulator with XRE-family HTH domain